MVRHSDDETPRLVAAIDDDPILDRPDALGLGGTPPPDAPSRRPQPRIIALLGEFFRMSRTTAILLGAFVLASALYLLVRDDPVVAFGPQPGGGSSETTEPADPVDPSSTPTEQTTGTTAPTPTSSANPTRTATAVPEGTAATSSVAEDPGDGGGQQTPQQQQQSEQSQQQSDQKTDQQSQSQQGDPGGAVTSVPDGGALEG